MDQKSELLVEEVQALSLDAPVEAKQPDPPLRSPFEGLATPLCGGVHVPLSDRNYPWRSRAELAALYTKMYSPCGHYVHELPNDGIRRFLLVFFADEKEPAAEVRAAMWPGPRYADADVGQHPPIIAVFHGRELRGGEEGDVAVAFWNRPAGAMR